MRSKPTFLLGRMDYFFPAENQSSMARRLRIDGKAQSTAVEHKEQPNSRVQIRIMQETQIHTDVVRPYEPRRSASLSRRHAYRIGLFDSGVGGLSVLRALQRAIPSAEYVYLGDTARLPYGPRSPETIVEYSMQASQFLCEAGVDAIVIACNTASSVALASVRRAFADIRVHGVVEAGSRAAVAASPAARIAVVGTSCTVDSRAYEKAIIRLAPHAEVHARACPFLVALAEEGWTDCDVALMAVRQYLEPLMEMFAPGGPDSIVLGCTHFSRFKAIIRQLLPAKTAIIDPADTLAQYLAKSMSGNLRGKKPTTPVSFYATDALQRFSRVGELFLGNSIPLESLERVDLDNK
jgi:glutamate racemase